MSKKFVRIQLSKLNKFTVINFEDYEKIKEWMWSFKRGYACGSRKKNGVRKIAYLHRIIMGANTGELVDHINNDKLDNRRCNLRICTPSENAQNCKTKNKYGFKGVVFCRDRNMFRAAININGRRIRSARCRTEEEAGRSYDDLVIKHYGDRALYQTLNFPEKFFKSKVEDQLSIFCDINQIKQLSFEV